MAMSAFGVEDNRLSKADHRAGGSHRGDGRAGGTFSRASGTHAAGRRFVGETTAGNGPTVWRPSAAQTQRSMGAGPTRAVGYENATVMRSPSASQRRQASVSAAGQKVRAGYDYVRSGQAREDAVVNTGSHLAAGKELASARAGRARSLGGQVGGDLKNAGRGSIAAVKLHPVRAGAIGAGITGAGAGIAYGVHRHNRSKLDQ